MKNYPSLNALKWKEFEFNKVFEYKRGKRYKKADHRNGTIAYISSTAFNNGIDAFVNPPNYMKIYKNKITLANSGSVGSCFYHSYDFVSSDHCMIIWIKNKELNKYIALFLSTILKTLGDRYGFDKEINKDRLLAEEISLPINKNNEIDYEFMQIFIKTIQKEMIKNLVLYTNKNTNYK